MLSKMRAAYEAATPGTWETYDERNDPTNGAFGVTVVDGFDVCRTVNANYQANAEFIALAHCMMPALLAAAERFDPNTQIAIIWGADDVQLGRPDLTDEQAMQVLLVVGRKHDANDGVNWDVLEAAAETLFPAEGTHAN